MEYAIIATVAYFDDIQALCFNQTDERGVVRQIDLLVHDASVVDDDHLLSWQHFCGTRELLFEGDLHGEPVFLKRAEHALVYAVLHKHGWNFWCNRDMPASVSQILFQKGEGGCFSCTRASREYEFFHNTSHSGLQGVGMKRANDLSRALYQKGVTNAIEDVKNKTAA